MLQRRVASSTSSAAAELFAAEHRPHLLDPEIPDSGRFAFPGEVAHTRFAIDRE
jgi:hypothetical protein